MASSIGGNGQVNTLGGGTGTQRGADGRLLISATIDGLLLTEVGVTTRLTLPAPIAPNPFAQTDTPRLPLLRDGAETFGLLDRPARDLLGVVTGAGAGAIPSEGVLLALVNNPGTLLSEWSDVPGFDVLLVMNLSGQPLTNVNIGTNDRIEPIRRGGFMTDPRFGGHGPFIDPNLGPDDVFVTLVPESTVSAVHLAFTSTDGFCDMTVPISEFASLPGGLLARVSSACNAACPADVVPDLTLDLLDVIEFINRVSTSDADADLDADSSVNFFDVLVFLRLFSEGCP